VNLIAFVEVFLSDAEPPAAAVNVSHDFTSVIKVVTHIWLAFPAGKMCFCFYLSCKYIFWHEFQAKTFSSVFFSNEDFWFVCSAVEVQYRVGYSVFQDL